MKGCGKWKKGEIVTVELDIKKWKLTFSKNDKVLGTVEIEEGKDYYPAVSVAGVVRYGDYQEYQLLVD